MTTMLSIKTLFTILLDLKSTQLSLERVSITKKNLFELKTFAKNYEYRCRPAAARVKSSETSRDLNGYLEPLTHLCTVKRKMYSKPGNNAGVGFIVLSRKLACESS